MRVPPHAGASCSLRGRPPFLPFSRAAAEHLIVAFSMAAIGFALCVLWQNQPVLGVIALCLANMGVLSIPALFWSLPTAFLTGVAAAAGIAMINSIGNLAGFVSPYMIGYLKGLTGRTDTALFVVAGGLVLRAVLVAVVLRARRHGNDVSAHVRVDVH